MIVDPSEPFAEEIAADLRELSELGERLESYLTRRHVSPGTVHAVGLVLEELVDNAIRHASNSGPRHRVRIRACVAAQGVRLRLADDMDPFDPTQTPSTAAASCIEDAAIGGRGLQLVRLSTTEFAWRHDRGQNVVDLVVPYR